MSPTRTYPHVGAADDSQAGESPGGDTSELTHLKHYRLLEVIGRGGMGIVYRAQDELLDRTIAVKLLRRDLGRDESFLRRFQVEAEAAAGLHHPNIAAVYDNGEDQGRRFYAMQFIDGESLLDRIRREGKLDVAEAVAIITQCLSALGAAHAEGLVHRDVKPGNVLLEAETGRAYLADFGLVRRMDAQTRLTMTGAIVGTTDYIPPEQARGQELDGRADLYSLGVMFYQMLSGRLPFIADTPSAMVFQHAREEPFPLDEAAPDLPPPLVELINRLLAKDPEDRPRDCHEVIEALAPFHPLPSRTRQLTSQVSAILMAAEPDSQTLDFALDRSYGPWQKARDRAATMLRRHTPDWIDALRTTGQHLEGAIAFCERRRRRLLALRQEGKSLLKELDEQIESMQESTAEEVPTAESSAGTHYQSPAEDTRQAHEKHLATTQTERNQISQQMEELDLELAKVDTRLAALRSQQVALENRLAAQQRSLSKKRSSVAVAAGILLLVGVFAGVHGWTWLANLVRSTDSEELGSGLGAAPNDRLDTSRSVLQMQPQSTLKGHTSKAYSLAFSEDGTRLASGSCGQHVILWDTHDGRQIKRFRVHENVVNSLVWLPDGETLITAGGDRKVKVWDLNSMKERCVLEGHTDYVDSVVLEPLGKHILSAGGDGTVRIWSLSEQQEVKRLTCPTGAVHELATHPNGQTTIAGTGAGKLFQWSNLEDPPKLIGSHRETIRSVKFSPDGRLLATGSLDGSAATWTSEGTTWARQGTFVVPDAQVYSVAFSPNGKFLAVGGGKHIFGAQDAFRDVPGQIRIWNVETGQLVAELIGHQQCVFRVLFSPDGTQLASAGADKLVLLWDVRRLQNDAITRVIANERSVAEVRAPNEHGREGLTFTTPSLKTNDNQQ